MTSFDFVVAHIVYYSNYLGAKMARKTIKYLSNSELLYEVNESKKSYCHFIDDQYRNFDFIPESLSELEDGDTIEAGKAARAKRLNALRVRQAIIDKEDSAQYKNLIKAEDIQTEDVVFRVMTYEHIPPAIKKRNTRNESGHYVKIPFPPFKHYIIDGDDIKEVGRSHWQDGLDNGAFCATHGNITPRLAGMFLKLVDRYSTKPNWRGYSYLDEMVADALMQLSAAALKFNEQKSNNPFAYFTQMTTNSFRGRLATEKKSQNLRDNLLIQNGAMPSFTKQIEDLEEQQQARRDAEEAAKNKVVDSEHLFGGLRSSNHQSGKS